MSPLDDELRAALHGRAAELTPAPDPLTGIERRARRMRRNRTATAVAGSVLAVAAIALAVPALTPSAGPPSPGPAVAPSTAPSPVPPSPAPSRPAPSSGAVAFSFDDPWEYRGDPSVLGNGARETWTREWAASKGAPVDEVDVVPLFGEVFEPSGQPRVVYAARVRASETMEYGLVTSTESGPEFLSQRPLTSGTTALLVPVPGDEVPALLVVASPDTRRIEYAADGTDFRPMTAKAPGVAIGPLEGDSSTDAVRVVAADGSRAYAGPAPDFRDSDEPASPPDNLLDWPFRGVPDDALVQRAVAGFALDQGVAPQAVEHTVLLTASNDPGQRYTVLQAWVPGERARVFGWVETPGEQPEPMPQPLTDPGEPVVAILLTGIPGRSTDELVVIPQPQTGQVLYTPEGGRERPVEPAPGLDGVVLVDRERGAAEDRLRLLDGDGDLDAPTFDGAVRDLLCGSTGCG